MPWHICSADVFVVAWCFSHFSMEGVKEVA